VFADIEGGKGTGGESIFGPVFEGIILKKNTFYIHEYLKKSGPAGGVWVSYYIPPLAGPENEQKSLAWSNNIKHDPSLTFCIYCPSSVTSVLGCEQALYFE